MSLVATATPMFRRGPISGRPKSVRVTDVSIDDGIIVLELGGAKGRSVAVLPIVVDGGDHQVVVEVRGVAR